MRMPPIRACQRVYSCMGNLRGADFNDRINRIYKIEWGEEPSLILNNPVNRVRSPFRRSRRFLPH
jgi:hypothetical protein